MSLITRFHWVPGPDGLAHAVPVRGRARAACGKPTSDEVPIRTRLEKCSRCRAVLGFGL